MIEFRNVTFTHKKGYGLNNLNLSIDEGEFSFLIGPTGSGKTTLMRLIYFDLFPDTGIVKVNGYSSNKLKQRQIPKIRKSIGMVFQNYVLLPDRNLFDNVALPLHVLG
ncbi:MAG: ATP-binding cassette domain-containing protein, partial [Candidatus Marinimicrobia bacterium]|nr:ATP-binding cassette domain-containing protein [Candidatus Neomarinimicrobiota bacterium]